MRNKISFLGSAVPLGCSRSALIPPHTLEGCYGFHRGARSDEHILTFLSHVPDGTVAEVNPSELRNQEKEKLNIHDGARRLGRLLFYFSLCDQVSCRLQEAGGF